MNMEVPGVPTAGRRLVSLIGSSLAGRDGAAEPQRHGPTRWHLPVRPVGFPANSAARVAGSSFGIEPNAFTGLPRKATSPHPGKADQLCSDARGASELIGG